MLLTTTAEQFWGTKLGEPCQEYGLVKLSVHCDGLNAVGTFSDLSITRPRRENKRVKEWLWDTIQRRTHFKLCWFVGSHSRTGVEANNLPGLAKDAVRNSPATVFGMLCWGRMVGVPVSHFLESKHFGTPLGWTSPLMWSRAYLSSTPSGVWC